MLQDYYVNEWAENFMLLITVNDAKAWYDHVSGILDLKKFQDALVRVPKKEGYGALVTYVWDSAGVLLHFAEYVNV